MKNCMVLTGGAYLTQHRSPQKIWQRIENSGGNSYHFQPQEWELGTLKEIDDDDDYKTRLCTILCQTYYVTYHIYITFITGN